MHLFQDHLGIDIDLVLCLVLLTVMVTIINLIRIIPFMILAHKKLDGKNIETVAIYGVSSSARQIAFGLQKSTSFRPVLFFTESSRKDKVNLDGIHVFDVSEAEAVLEKYFINTVLIDSTYASKTQRQKFISSMLKIKKKVRIFQMFEGGFSSEGLLRDVSLLDLIGREKKTTDTELMSTSIVGKRVLVTGAAGSIGLELCKQISRLSPKRLDIVDINEAGLKSAYEAICEVDGIAARYHLINIADSSAVKQLLSNNKYDLIFHAAAYKHVDVAEFNILSFVKNNVLGTYNLVRFAVENDVPQFVNISSDKAVEPINIMGLTKYWGEIITKYFVEDNKSSKRTSKNELRYCTVRFGNVLESSGSVIPIFKNQIKNMNPITITDKKMKRYFMSLDEAAELVIQSSQLSSGGEVFVLNMGLPIKITEIARKLVNLAGLRIKDNENPLGDIEMIEIGCAPNEKLVEKLYFDHEKIQPTSHPSISMAKSISSKGIDFEGLFDKLLKALDEGDESTIKKILTSLPLLHIDKLSK